MKVLLITAHGLQARALGPYGNSWISTPNLDRLAAAGVVGDWHLADCADGAGAAASWRTASYNLPVPGEPAVPRAGDDLLSILRARGIPTCLIADESRGPSPMLQGAGEWSEVRRIGAEGEGTPLERCLDAAGEVLGGLVDQADFLLWLDLATVLPPWETPDDFVAPYFEEGPSEEEEDEDEELEDELEAEDGEEEEEVPLTPLQTFPFGPIDPIDDHLYLSLQTSYAAAVSYLDAGVGQLLEALDEMEGGSEVVVLFTAGSGLPLGEHGVVGAVRAWAHEEQLHVPLIVRAPGVVPRRLSALTQSIDVAATLADLFGAQLPGCHGHSLMPLIRGEAAKVRDYACCGVAVEGEVEWCLRTDKLTFLLPLQAAGVGNQRGPQLYVKPDDSWEVNNVIQHHLEVAEELERTMRAFVAATRGPAPLTPPPLPEQIT
jgi:arylsulfatase A-like enzyme